jgi:hypothetical protein
MYTDTSQVMQDSTYTNSTLRKLLHKAQNTIFKVQKILHNIQEHKSLVCGECREARAQAASNAAHGLVLLPCGFSLHQLVLFVLFPPVLNSNNN